MPSKRICLSNALLFASQYMLIPVLPVALAENMELSVLSTGRIFLAFVAGMVAVGPLHSYLIDTYRTKQLSVFSFAVLILVNLGYYLLNRPLEIFFIPLVQGGAFGLASLSLTTIGIDLTASEGRDRQNILFGWYARVGVLAGVALGAFLYLNRNVELVLLLSAIFLLLSQTGIVLLHIPFRAPIGVSICSADRFFLPRSWFLFLNMVMVTFVLGLFLPLIYSNMTDLFVAEGIYVPYWVMVLLGFLLSMIGVRRYFSDYGKIRGQILTGLSTMVVAVSVYIFFTLTGLRFLQLFSALLLGGSVGMVAPAFLYMFVRMSSHCQRATANTTYILSWQTGISIGVALACYLHTNLKCGYTFHIAMFTAVACLLFFLLFSYPRYRKNL